MFYCLVQTCYLHLHRMTEVKKLDLSQQQKMSTEGFEPSPLARSESQISLAKLALESDALDHSAKLTALFLPFLEV